MLTRRTVFAGLAATFLTATPGLAHDTQIANVSGLYSAYGMNSNGSTYTGQVQIVQNGNAVDVYWQVGGQSYTGRGLLHGRVLTVDWGDSTPVIYVLVGAELHGTWAGGTALERLVRR